MTITTHVLDTASGRPAEGVPVLLHEAGDDGAWLRAGGGTTDADGRLSGLVPDGRSPRPGRHRLLFDTGAYFAAAGVSGFFPEVAVTFDVADPDEHYHVPLLLSPHGYTTYRGS